MSIPGADNRREFEEEFDNDNDNFDRDFDEKGDLFPITSSLTFETNSTAYTYLSFNPNAIL